MIYDLLRSSIILSCLTIVGLIWYQPVIAASEVCMAHHCVAIVDAGSTGSRLHVYAYDLDANQQPVYVFEHYARRINPGLATLRIDPEIINQYLTELFKDQLEQSMPVYVYATGGMRLRSEQEQQHYFNALREWFALQHTLSLKDARTISGTEEGVFAWLAVNEPLGVLNVGDPAYAGVMDIGGASTQVVFAVKNKLNILPEDLVEFELYGKHISLFSHSFLGLGNNEVRKRFKDLDVCFPKGYPLANNKLGNGDAFLCQQKVSNEINAKYNIQNIVGPILSQNPSASWMVLGAVSALLKKFPNIQKELSLQALLQLSHDVHCTPTWQDQSIQHPEDQDLYSSCLLGAYYYALTVNGYGLAPEQSISYSSNIQESDWTLGAVLHPL